MADVDYGDYRADGGGMAAPGRFQQAISMIAAILSVALVLGLAWWGYKLAVRDVAGVPVVRALEGPMRVAPENPGGAVTAHQGLAVNEVAAVGGAAGSAERIVLAPRPVDLTEEDAPGTIAALAPPVSGRSDGMVALALPDTQALPAPPSPLVPQDAIAAALAEALGQDAGPEVTRLAASAVPLAGTLGGEAPRLVLSPSMPRGAVASAVRPRPRPGRGADGVVMPASLPSAAVVEADADSLPAGTRLVQLGAFDTAEAARADWDKLAGRFGDLLTDKARVVQPAQSGGRTFWRLRAQGFGSEADARRFCAALLSEGAACIPVTLR